MRLSANDAVTVIIAVVAKLASRVVNLRNYGAELNQICHHLYT